MQSPSHTKEAHDYRKHLGGSTRRDFLRLIGLGAAANLSPAISLAADAIETSDLRNLIPADKKLDTAWVKSLFERGEPTVYRGAELATIGMPVGGICTGQVYLGGDGKLWHWDIFNQYIHTGCEGPHYAKPMKPTSPLEQGFGIRVSAGGTSQFRTLDREGFSDITFRGEYPIGLVEYKDSATPLIVSLEAFSPFAPLDTEESSLPATIMQFTVKNTGGEPLEAELVGWLENAVGLHQKPTAAVQRHNRVVRQPQALLLNCDTIAEKDVKLEDGSDIGSMCLALLDPQTTDAGAATASLPAIRETALADLPDAGEPLGKKLIGALARKLSLPPGGSATVAFAVAWHFPNLRLKSGENDLKLKDDGRFYAERFHSAAEVAGHVAENFASLVRQTRLWRDTWYDSTLPYWFLDRTFANTSILATSTCYRFKSGRFYAWEGVGCCEGTCTHVWQYAQAAARLFPELERDLRSRTDFGTALDPQSGEINFRSEGAGMAVDGQAGCILRAYREHQMSADDAFLKAVWPQVKLAMQCLVRMDDGEGILAGAQHNTLDQPWFGKIAWLSSLYIAAARACEEMAKELGDETFAKQMREIVARGSRNIDGELFNGEYYIQIADKDHAKSVGSHDGCEIDQVFGQSWAYQVGLGRILDERNVKKSLASLWKYNFTRDVGAFREKQKPGRWYAMPGEGGLVMCSWPRGDAKRLQDGYDYYFNECMSGFEYQVAAHMIWEGMLTEGMAITRTIHDRYHASRRNPWNEIECGDHYARAMASYGVFLAACGYEYHGPKGHLAFVPRIQAENFRAAFTTAEGWGTFWQKDEGKKRTAAIELKWGKLNLHTLSLGVPENMKPAAVDVTVDGSKFAAEWVLENRRLTITFPDGVKLSADQRMEITIA